MRHPLVCWLLAITSSSLLVAQEEAKAKPAIGGLDLAGGGGKPSRRSSGPTLAHLQFEGGSLSEFVGVLRATAGESLNIVVDEKANDVVLTPFELKQISVVGALKVAQSAVQGDSRVAVERIREEPEDQEVFVIRVASPPAAMRSSSPAMAGAAAQGPPLPRRLAITSIAARLGDGNKPEVLETVLSAIQEALVLLGKEVDPPTFKFHADSGLLMVRGTDEHIETVDQVIEQLALRGGQPASSESSALKNLELELNVLRQQNAELRQQLEELRQSTNPRPALKPVSK